MSPAKKRAKLFILQIYRIIVDIERRIRMVGVKEDIIYLPVFSYKKTGYKGLVRDPYISLDSTDAFSVARVKK